ncbi:murein DD-endopeptidase MepM/ murein hydrolase activator NlpD [Paenibacillus endophyticus]|uniref:Murein DD-endopeptidase MepM/ murein hydrolase activator NlpD n=1 Tax=Paenibacillus endophyticus TaxID=1294268 RepID=A0A7W5C8X6_9BACL|nr:M23 family metallopeptidase [Paenibacillus endophyticus]MBB3152879.1 murein DD-endopeptidase MepM/ murein hydrolase activator NlpD [Paenibacillus endophyticus]
MTVFRDKGRIQKVWNQSIQYFRRDRSQHLSGKKQQQPASDKAKLPIWRRKPVQLAGGALVLLTVAGFSGIQYVQANTVEFYNVYMNGTAVGTVSDPQEVEQLVLLETEEVQQANPGLNMVLDTGTITYEATQAFKGTPETDVTLDKLEGLFASHAVGVEVKVDGKVIGIVKDQQTADDVLLRVQSKFAPELAAAKKNQKEVKSLSFDSNEKTAPAAEAKPVSKTPGREVMEVEFIEAVMTESIDIDPEQIMEAEAIYKMLVQGSIQPTKYTVQAGDCVGCIAQKFDISPEVIYKNNAWIKDDKITIGDVLDLTVLQPELTVKTIENLVEVETIEPPVEIKKNADMRVGESKTISEGSAGSKRLTYRITKQNGYVVSEELLTKEVIKEAMPKIVERGTKVILGEGTGRFAMPVSGSRLTSKFGKRWGRMHNGIDLTGNKNIHASDNGIVEFVGTKPGLGKTIIINHKNGYTTVYGHLSSYKTKVGAVVEQGDTIGIMGSTGNSTGVHLHFEVHKDGVLQNPLKYL